MFIFVLKIVTTVLIALMGTAVAYSISKNPRDKYGIVAASCIEIVYMMSLLCMWG